MALYKAYPAHIILLRRAFAVVAGVRGAAGDAVLERSRPLLQLAAPGVVENQRAAGVDGAGGRKPLTISINPPAAKKITRPPGCPGGFFAACLHSFLCAALELAGAYFAGARYFCRLRS